MRMEVCFVEKNFAECFAQLKIRELKIPLEISFLLGVEAGFFIKGNVRIPASILVRRATRGEAFVPPKF